MKLENKMCNKTIIYTMQSNLIFNLIIIHILLKEKEIYFPFIAPIFCPCDFPKLKNQCCASKSRRWSIALTLRRLLLKYAQTHRTVKRKQTNKQ